MVRNLSSIDRLARIIFWFWLDSCVHSLERVIRQLCPGCHRPGWPDYGVGQPLPAVRDI